MQVVLQDCGCIALPDEVVAALSLPAGAGFQLHYEMALRTLRLVVPHALYADQDTTVDPSGAACRAESSLP